MVNLNYEYELNGSSRISVLFFFSFVLKILTVDLTH